MTTGIMELNDAGVRVGKGEDRDGDHHPESPGVALLERKELLLGEAALRHARLHPLQTNSWFWHRLSTEPLSLEHSQFRHHADLAYSHLLSLHQAIPDCDEIIFALPGSFTRQQMSLLLGIVGQCPFRAVGLVDSAVAACAPYVKVATVKSGTVKSGTVASGTVVHADLQLHQCVFTQMHTDQQLQRTQVEVLPHSGLFALRDQWAKAIADQFIDQTRFDPLHSATTEQSLHDQLPDWLRQCEYGGELFLEISGKTIKMTREQLIQAVQPIYGQIMAKAAQLARPQGQFLVSDRLAALPGLLEACEPGLTAEPLPASAVLRGVYLNSEVIKIDNEPISFIQALPLPARAAGQRTAAVEAPRPAAPDTGRVTHLLFGATAYPLDQQTVYVDLKNQRLATDPTTLDAQFSLRRQGDGVVLLPHGGAAVTVNAGKVDERRASDNCLLHRGDSIGGAGSATAPLTLIEVHDQ
jgi:hypothetical protein